MDIRKMREENANLKKPLCELAPSDSENNKLLLERIISLETIIEMSSEQLAVKDEEITLLRRQLNLIREKTDDSMLEQINCHARERESSENLNQSPETKKEKIKKKLVTLSDRCQELETKVTEYQALEKNQQWVAYDQQREAHVKRILATMLWLEKQLNQANQAPSDEHNEAHSDILTERDIIVEMQEHYEDLLFKAKRQLEVLRETVSMAHCDPDEMLLRYEEKRKEVDELKQELQEILSNRKSAEEANIESKLRAKVKELQDILTKEKHQSDELLLQVTRLLVNYQEDQKKMAIFEQQIQVCSKDLEDERQDCLYLQKHLKRVCKELRKTRGHVKKLSEQRQVDASSYETSSQNSYVPYKPSRENETSYYQRPNLLEESFLECPGCQAQYPSSKHRELLAHLDYCLV